MVNVGDGAGRGGPGLAGWTRLLFPAIALVATLLCPAPAEAQSDCPSGLAVADDKTSTTLSGRFCTGGQLGKDQLYLNWEVPEADRHVVWQLRLAGNMGSLAQARIFRVERNAAGEIQRSDGLTGLALSELDAGKEGPGFLMAPGSYLLILGALNPTSFRLEATPLLRDALPGALKPGATVGGVSAGQKIVLPLSVAAADARKRWRLELFLPPGGRGAFELATAAGERLAMRTYDAGSFVFHDLGLDPGDYLLSYTSWDGKDLSYVARLLADGPRAPVRANEPDDDPKRANRLTLGRTVQGRTGEAGDIDFFTFDAPAAGTLTEVALTGGRERTELCLATAAGAALQCRQGADTRLVQLALEGPQYAYVRGPADRNSYGLTVRAAGLLEGDAETEPNDTPASALALQAGATRQGLLSGADVDVYRFVAEGEPSLWSVAATGSGLKELSLVDRDGQTVARTAAEAPRGAAELRLDEVYLPPAPYTAAVLGTDGAYRLSASATGRPDLRLEREPNPDSNPNRLRLGAERLGRLTDLNDRDVYRFSLAAPTHVALTLTPPADAVIDMEIEWGWPALRRPTASAVRSPVTYDALLEPGDYVVRLRPSRPAPGQYSLRLDYADPFHLPSDLEPNDSPSQARPLPDTLRVEGRVGDFADEDWFTIPAGAGAGAGAGSRRARVALDAALAVRVLDGASEVPVEWAEDRRSFAFTIADNREVRLGLRGAGPYVLDAAIDGVTPAPRGGTGLPLAVQLELGSPRVAAYWLHGQRVPAALRLRNTGNEPLQLALDARSSHVDYTPRLERSEIRLEPHAGAEVPVEIVVAPDARGGIDAQIGVRARDAAGNQGSATAVMVADAETPPVNPYLDFAIAAPLRGGFNLAAAAFGGRGPPGQSEAEAAAQSFLFDNLVGQSFVTEAAKAPVAITRLVGGDRPWPIAGIVLHPQAADRVAPAEQLRDFELLLSDDGATFTPVLRGSLSMIPQAQSFVLDSPRHARAAQLRLLTNHADNLGSIGLNEWQLISRAAPEGLAGLSLDAADPANGGYLAWSRPVVGTWRESKLALLPGASRSLQAKVNASVRPSFTVGFRDGRAVDIDHVAWTDDKEPPPPARNFGDVAVAISLDGPLGPWRNVGVLAAKRGGEARRLELPANTWARYVRFTAASGDTQARPWNYPRKIAILERPIGAQRPSALGEWGFHSRAAAYEALQPPTPAPPMVTPGSSRESPAQFDLATGASGVVQQGVTEDWYAFKAPDAPGSLRFTLAGEPTINADLELTDGDGNAVNLRQVELAGTRLVFEADPSPGTELRLRVFEPARSVAVAYDTSSSLAQFVPAVRQATAAFAEGLRRGREFMNIMNFESPFLLEEWSDEPWVVQGALAGRTAETLSSDLETTLINVSEGLQKRKGTRAVILVTDAESTGTLEAVDQLWTELGRLRPIVFAGHVGIGSDLPGQTQLMQTLAAVTGGAYSRATIQSDLDVLAERAAAWLRRPVAYRLTAQVVPPGSVKPGGLVILARAKPAPGTKATPGAPSPGTAAALAIVLDASGSMLQRLQGQQRIEIARRTLNDVLKKDVSAGSMVALRVFGDDAPGSCATRLAMPLAPLDMTAAARVLKNVRPRNGAKTPIAASLAAVANDLKEAAGPRTVVLITDGEETCGGDPRAEIQKLAESGLDVRVNIVGFAVDEPQLKAQFADWAAAGRGAYFDAAKPAELGAALTQAVGGGYQVFGAAGLVAQGIVGGDALQLPPGRYRVEIGGRTAFDDVLVEPGEVTQLAYDK